MGSDYFSNPLEFLIRILVGLYTFAVLLRFILQAVRADFHNPISQAIVRVTNPPLVAFRRFIPGVGGIDWAAIVLMLALQMCAWALISAVKLAMLSPLALFGMALIELILMTTNLFFFSILVQVILSWVNPQSYNPAVSLLHQINEPLLRPVRRLLPQMGGIDLSPILVIIGLKLLDMLLIPPIRALTL